MLIGYFQAMDEKCKGADKVKKALENLNTLQWNNFKSSGAYATVEAAKIYLQEALDILE